MLKVKVVNLAGEEVDAMIEIATKSSIVKIERQDSWRSETMTHGGLIEASEPRKWLHRATLSFTGTDLNEQIIQIKVYKAPRRRPDGEPLRLVGELKHPVLVK